MIVSAISLLLLSEIDRERTRARRKREKRTRKRTDEISKQKGIKKGGKEGGRKKRRNALLQAQGVAYQLNTDFLIGLNMRA